MLSEAAEFIIQGVTVEGNTSLPAGWAERLCNLLAKVGLAGRKMYFLYVRPVVPDGINAAVERIALQKAGPEAFDMIKRNIAENRLMVRLGRGSRDAESGGPPPVVGKERCDPIRNIR